MSVESMAIALNHSRARGTAKLVLIGIANHDGDGGAWPAVATLARYAGVTARNVRKALRELETLGEIRTHCQAGGTGRGPEYERPNLYDFLLACPEGCDRTQKHRVAPPVGCDTRGMSEATPDPLSNPTAELSLEPPAEPSLGPADTGHRAARSTSAASTRRRKPKPLKDGDIPEQFAVLSALCQESGDDPWDVWHTLMLEHGAVNPAAFMADLVGKGQWDGFLGVHGISDYSDLRSR